MGSPVDGGGAAGARCAENLLAHAPVELHSIDGVLAHAPVELHSIDGVLAHAPVELHSIDGVLAHAPGHSLKAHVQDNACSRLPAWMQHEKSHGK